jgi:peroxiredoxin
MPFFCRKAFSFLYKLTMTIKLPIFILFLNLLSISILAQDQFTFAREGQTAPDFTFETSDGLIHRLSDLKGKVVWITFFATWCGPCRKELPHLEKQVYEKYKNHPDFELLVVGREHTREELQKFQADTGHTLPFIPDPKREIFSKYASQNIPRNFIIDKSGKIVVSSVGFTEEEFHDYLQKLSMLLSN